MNSKKHLLFSFFLVVLIAFSSTFLSQAKELRLSSPNGKIETIITVENEIHFSIFFDNNEIIKPSGISLEIEGTPKASFKVKKTSTRQVDEKIIPVVASKNSVIPDQYNELSIILNNNYILTFRAYNDGIGYRFQSSNKNDIIVLNESLELNFSDDFPIYFPKEESFFSHNERKYEFGKMSKFNDGELCSLPALIAPEKGPNILISESDIEDYPGMWIQASGAKKLSAIFPKAAAAVEINSDRDVPVTKRENYLAKTKGNRNFPWRVFIIVENDKDLIESELVYKLAKPNQLKETSWIKPGKVAWDWWNSLNIYGVDFESGVNTESYKYFIDFASKYGIEYIILDEGWYKLGNLFDINPDINMEEILAYGKEKNVGIILWVIWKTLDDQLEEALNLFEKWGVAGIKVDFMQRDDQWMVNYYHKIAKEAAKRKLLVDYHGAYKPAGLRRTYPNVITREGVRGMEWNKWSDVITPEHDLTIPFIRMVAGPMDFTPGAMINAQDTNYLISFTKPMSQGTRVHQMAMYVVYESPLQMLADNPSNYYKEPECTKFISEVPVVWDETRVLDAKVSDYIVIARRSGKEWFLAAMTDNSERELKIDFSFLPDGMHSMEVFQDGINANTYASDYKIINTMSVTKNDNLTIKLAKGGGWVARIK